MPITRTRGQKDNTFFCETSMFFFFIFIVAIIFIINHTIHVTLHSYVIFHIMEGCILTHTNIFLKWGKN